MNVARHHFLARAGLAENQHIGIERSDLLDEPMHIAHRARRAAGPKAMQARLGRVTAAHILCLMQDRRQTALLDGQVEMKPCKVAAGFGDFRQSVIAQVDDRQRLGQGAQLRYEVGAHPGNCFFADDDGEAVLRLAMRMLAQFIQIVDVERLEIQKPQQGLEGASLRI